MRVLYSSHAAEIFHMAYYVYYMVVWLKRIYASIALVSAAGFDVLSTLKKAKKKRKLMKRFHRSAYMCVAESESEGVVHGM